MENEFLYVFSSDLDVNVQLRICSLEGSASAVERSCTVAGGNFFVTITIYCNGRLIGFPVSTSYKAPPSSARITLHTWDECIPLPVKYSELSRDAFLHACLYDVSETVEPRFIAQATVSLFSKRAVLRSGTVNLRMEAGPYPDPFAITPSATKYSKQLEVDRLQKLTKDYGDKFIDHVDWLDRITFPCIEKIKKEKEMDQRCLYLMIEMPRIIYGGDRYAVVYYEKEDDPKLSTSCAGNTTDPELNLENLCEVKNHMMMRNARAGIIDRDLKPNATARDVLRTILQMPSSHPMSVEQRDLIWKFRYYLRNDRKALTKFVRSVNWDETEEATQALQLIREWQPVEAGDALELLSPSFLHKEVRHYAVSRLANASPEQILLFLPQLVQALKYEPFSNVAPSASKTLKRNLEESERKEEEAEGQTEKAAGDIIGDLSGDDLASFLVRTACSDALVANYLYWYLKVEIEATAEIDANVSRMYVGVLDRMLAALRAGGNETTQRAASLERQQNLIDILVSMAKLVSQENGSRSQKQAALQKALREKSELLALGGLPLPLDPSVRVYAIIPDVATLFSSNLMPMKLSFRTDCTDVNKTYVTIFKRGDDLRQDQLVIQMFRLMDQILRADGLDLRLTPYSVLATSVSEGFVQFVKATPLRDVMSNRWGSIQGFLRSYRPYAGGPFGIEPEVVDNYVRSCAGYSVICYILGIGDRHLDNLLLCENGRMFHVDFGYILGRDPKPLPPPMKLTTEMINGMGGSQSKEWRDFRAFCFSAFNILRRHANLILNLFSLMLDAGIPDIAIEKDKAVQKIEQRFHLSLSDELADQLIQRLIDESASAKMPIFVDFVHDVKQKIIN